MLTQRKPDSTVLGHKRSKRNTRLKTPSSKLASGKSNISLFDLIATYFTYSQNLNSSKETLQLKWIDCHPFLKLLSGYGRLVAARLGGLGCAIPSWSYGVFNSISLRLPRS